MPPVIESEVILKNFLEKVLEDKKLKTLTLHLSNNKSFELNTLENKVCIENDYVQFEYYGELYTVNPFHIVSIVQYY